MSSPIYDLYDYYKDKPVNNDYLEKAFNIVMEEEKELVPYISGLKVLEGENENLGGYSYKDGEITIHKDLFRKYQQPSLEALATLRHEVEHARNLMKVQSGKKDIETTVLKCALRDYELLNNINEREEMDNYDLIMLLYRIKANKKINPDERIAEIQAWKYVVNLIKNKRRTDDLLYARSMLYYAYTDGYNNNGYYLESPTLEFLIRTDLVDEYCYIKRRMERENYTFDTRLTTGLPVTQEEYDKGILQKVRLQKRKR